MSASISIAESRKDFGGGGYSSVVQLFLEIDGLRLALRQVGDGEMYFAEPVTLASKAAKLVVDVDGEVTVREITIMDNDALSKRIRFV
jgi:hypothetical protein